MAKQIYVSFPQMGVPQTEAVYNERLSSRIADAVAARPFCMFFRCQVGAVKINAQDADDRDDLAQAAAQAVYDKSGSMGPYKAVEITGAGVRTELADPVPVVP
jgi:hypothetical protein